MPSKRHIQLAEFVNTLEEALDWEFDYNEFDDRIRIQKYIHLADAYDFDHDYTYGMYLHGPYSPTLAEDYYEEEFHTVRAESHETLHDFDSRGFADLVNDRSRHWLEVAATIKSLYTKYSRTSTGDEPVADVIKKTTDLKETSDTEARSIYSTLAANGVLEVS